MEPAQRPMFGLIKSVDEAAQRELIPLSHYLKLRTVDDLVRYSKRQIKGLDVSDAVLDEIERVLDSKYKLKFSATDFVPRQPPTPVQEAAAERKVPRASGAPPRSVYQGTPTDFGLERYLI